MRTDEVFALDCRGCTRPVELLTGGDMRCPNCGATLDVQWRDEPEPMEPSAEPETQRLATEALARARARHADFDYLWPLMGRLNDLITFDWRFIGFDDYYEALYALVRYAEFAQPARTAAMAQNRIAQLSQAAPISDQLQ